MNAVDSSVAVAGFATWHEFHTAAREVLDDGATLVAHSALETYSVLTRLPPPHRAPGDVAAAFLADQFPEPWLTLPPDDHLDLVTVLPERGVTGGAAYDALIAASARIAGATLVSCDRRALTTYERMGAEVRLIP